MSQDSIKPFMLAAKGEHPARRPIWFMRQAGRYLPEYMEIRKSTSFVDLCRTPSLAAEVTLQPLRRYDLDASIIFSDILIPCTAFGQEFSIDKGHGPHLSPPVRDAKSLSHLKDSYNVKQDLGYVGEAIELVKAKLKPEQTMIGFAGAPFTVASYMIEGGPSKNFTEVKKLMFTAPEVFSELIDKLCDLTYEYLAMQVNAGADVVMLFDSWAANLAGFEYRNQVFPKTRGLLTKVKKEIGCPVIYYPGQGAHILYELSDLETDVLAIDWRITLAQADSILKGIDVNCALQGNLDPQYLIGSEAFVRKKTRIVLDSAKATGRGHIFNLGHGLLPHTPPESLTWVIDEVRKYR